MRAVTRSACGGALDGGVGGGGGTDCERTAGEAAMHSHTAIRIRLMRMMSPADECSPSAVAETHPDASSAMRESE